MQEGISYLAGAELPCVIVDVMRGGPGLGNIGPAQGDYFQVVKGGGHGDYRTLVLAPNSVQEMCDLTILAFELADRYRNPVVVLADGVLGQMMEAVEFLPAVKELPPKPWAVTGEAATRRNLVGSIHMHGQFRFNFRHPEISREQSADFLMRAFERDFHVNGPSVGRIAATLLRGWQRHRRHPEARVRRRVRRDSRGLASVYAGALWAIARYFRVANPAVASASRELGRRIARRLPLAWLMAPLVGGFLLSRLRREAGRLRGGWTYEPPTFVERRPAGAPAGT
jgi:hypothetical protein